MTDGPQILAKSRSHGVTITLAEHTRAVVLAATVMFGTLGGPTRLAAEWLRFFRLNADDFEAFLSNLCLAAALHDIGKANDGMQRALQGRGEQVIRHEHLSALLLWEQPLRGWLQTLRTHGVDDEVIISAVVSHHLKVNPQEFGRCLIDAERPVVQVQAGAPDVRTAITIGAQQLGVDTVDVAGVGGAWGFRDTISPMRDRFQESMHLFGRALGRDERRRRLLLAVKAALVAADSAGSAMPRMGQNLDDWLRAAFEQPPLTGDDIERGVIEPRVRELERKGSWKGFHDFQIAAGELGPRALLLSGCGTGKTLAAWKWIGAQLRRRPAARVIFLYPTRASATEGFRDYVSWSGPAMAALVSGTSKYDLQDMFTDGDPRSAHDYTAEQRLFALSYWHRRVFSATVDSFLAFVTNRYAAMCLLPLLVDSVVVFDEVHSFDNNMFRALERLLTAFDLPVLCMTASLPEDRIRVLKDECGLEVFPSGPQEFADLQQQAEAPRYRVRWVDAEDCYRIALEALQAGKKALWVVNTVARCQDVARRVSHLLQREPVAVKLLCYHSRFRLDDRRARHREVVRLFQSQRGASLVVTTQVCEMSLDLDADVLITEAANVPAVIQRMGRCCREPLPGPQRFGEVYVYRPDATRPYTRQEVEEASTFAQDLAQRPRVSHADLASYLSNMATADPYATGGFTGFLDSNWYAMGRDDSFREEDDFTVDCVLESDLVRYLEAVAAGAGDAAGFIVPVPRQWVRSDPRLGRFVHLAPTSEYSAELGFQVPEAGHYG